MKRGVDIFVCLSLILIFSVAFVSAGFFSDVFGKIIGKAISSTSQADTGTGTSTSTGIVNPTSTGAKSPRTMTTVNPGGAISWIDYDYAKASDNYYASATSNSATTPFTSSLRASNFGFSIPTGATINGILVEIERSSSNIEAFLYTLDHDVKIVDDSGNPGSTDYANFQFYWPVLDAYTSYGGSTDLWGNNAWTPAKINDPDFGVIISANLIDLTGRITAKVDHIRITVYYTEATTVTPSTSGSTPSSGIVYSTSLPEPIADYVYVQKAGDIKYDTGDSACTPKGKTCSAMYLFINNGWTLSSVKCGDNARASDTPYTSYDYAAYCGATTVTPPTTTTVTPSTTTATCIDSDGKWNDPSTNYGNNPTIKGKCTNATGTYLDSCSEDKLSVKEMLCDSDGKCVTQVPQACSSFGSAWGPKYICQDGACVVPTTCIPACTTPTPKCNSAFTCVECLTANDCIATGKQKCNPTTQSCVECLTTSDCVAGKVCQSGTCTAPPTCPTCIASKPKCNSATLTCVECLTTSDCTGGKVCQNEVCVVPTTCTPACTAPKSKCNSAFTCVECLTANDCIATGKPKCNPTTLTCVECLTTSDCVAGKVCQSGTCVTTTIRECTPSLNTFNTYSTNADVKKIVKNIIYYSRESCTATEFSFIKYDNLPVVDKPFTLTNKKIISILDITSKDPSLGAYLNFTLDETEIKYPYDVSFYVEGETGWELLQAQGPVVNINTDGKKIYNYLVSTPHFSVFLITEPSTLCGNDVFNPNYEQCDGSVAGITNCTACTCNTGFVANASGFCLKEKTNTACSEVGKKECAGTNLYTCNASLMWKTNGIVVGECGVNCSPVGTSSCDGETSLTCGAAYQWIMQGKISGFCGYVSAVFLNYSSTEERCGNGICNYDEDEFSCPEDCAEELDEVGSDEVKPDEVERNWPKILLIIFIIILILVIIVVLFKLFNKRKTGSHEPGVPHLYKPHSPGGPPLHPGMHGPATHHAHPTHHPAVHPGSRRNIL